MIADGLRRSVEHHWYTSPGWLYVLAPLVPVFALLSRLRERTQKRRAQNLPVPVMVVGNITAGGTGKTPLTIALVEALQKAGYRPGVVSRGYGRTRVAPEPIAVTAESDASEVGDEPLLIARVARCPVAVARDRVAAAESLIEQGVDVILCDDGLQHYRLGRDLEMAVVDARRGLGNGWLQPVGPLREPAGRLENCDWLCVNGEAGMAVSARLDRLAASHKPLVPLSLKARALVHLASGQRYPLSHLKKLGAFSAVCAIGHPARFIRSLEQLEGSVGRTFTYPDHHAYSVEDMVAWGEGPVVVTEKDAVKLQGRGQQNIWYLAVGFDLPDVFIDQLLARVQHLVQQKKTQVE